MTPLNIYLQPEPGPPPVLLTGQPAHNWLSRPVQSRGLGLVPPSLLLSLSDHHSHHMEILLSFSLFFHNQNHQQILALYNPESTHFSPLHPRSQVTLRRHLGYGSVSESPLLYFKPSLHTTLCTVDRLRVMNPPCHHQNGTPCGPPSTSLHSASHPGSRGVGSQGDSWLVCCCSPSTWQILNICNLILFIFWPRHTTCVPLLVQPGTEPMPPALGVQSLNHRTAREVSIYVLIL